MKKKKIPKMTPEHDSTREQNVLLEKVYKEVKTVAEGHSLIQQELNQLTGSAEKRFNTIEKRFDMVGQRFNMMEKRFDMLETAVMVNNKQIRQCNTKIDSVEQKLDIVTQDHETRLQKLETIR